MTSSSVHDLPAKERAIECLKTNRIHEARQILEQITATDAADAEAWFLLGATHGLSGNAKGAELCSRQAVALSPDYLTAWNNLGKALNDQDKFSEATEVFRKTLERHPHDVAALTGLAHALAQQNQLTEAFKICRRSIELAPNNVDAYITMGNLFYRQGQFEQALSWYQQTISLNPASLQAIANLSLSLKALGRYQEATEWAKRALSFAPNSAWPHYSLGMLYLIQHKHSEAAISLREAFKLDPGHLEAGTQLAAVLRHMGNVIEAIEVYRQILETYPDDQSARFYFSALQEGSAPTQLPPELLKEIYDQQETADGFDHALVDRLEYRLPQRLGHVMWEIQGETEDKLDVLDLGCGTGLYGKELRPLARTLAGVDLSSKMIEKARQKNIYDTLIVEDLSAFLRTCEQNYDLITAMDVLMFFGDLDQIFEGCAAILRPGGIFAFDVEKSDGSVPWRFHPYGHYSHAAGYIRELASRLNLQEIHFEETYIRKEADKPRSGYLCLYRKPIR